MYTLGLYGNVTKWQSQANVPLKECEMPPDDRHIPASISSTAPEMADDSREKLLQSFARLVSKGYATKADADGSGYPVEVVCGNAVPIRGNVHIGLGRAISRTKIDKQFAR